MAERKFRLVVGCPVAEWKVRLVAGCLAAEIESSTGGEMSVV